MLIIFGIRNNQIKLTDLPGFSCHSFIWNGGACISGTGWNLSSVGLAAVNGIFEIMLFSWRSLVDGCSRSLGAIIILLLLLLVVLLLFIVWLLLFKLLSELEDG